MTFDIAFVGHYTKDTIVYPHLARTVDGGAFYYGANVAVRMGLRVAVVTRLALEDWHVVGELERLGVTVFARATPASTLLRLTYPTANLDERTIELTSSAGPFTVGEVADLQARAVAIGASVRGEVPLEVVEALAVKKAIVALDVQGFIRVVRDGTLTFDDWPGKESVLKHVTVLKTDAVEARLITGESDRYAAARQLAAFGPPEVLLTHRGGVLVYHDGVIDEAPFVPEEVRGRSGRGDTCTSAYLSRRLTAPPAEAVRWAAALTSLKLEAEGPFRREAAEVEALYRRLCRER
ncbi:MAG: carbohydrate kinase [Candidatus Methylomirabilales bacterium]